IGSFVRLLAIDRGFIAERVLSVDAVLPASRYWDRAARLSAYDRLVSAVEAIPGVDGASTSSMLPLSRQGQVMFVAVEGDARSPAEQPSVNFRFVAPNFFRALGIQLRRGRAFTNDERDPNRPAPALVSESTAARLWPGVDPIGKRFSRGIAGEQGF